MMAITYHSLSFSATVLSDISYLLVIVSTFLFISAFKKIFFLSIIQFIYYSSIFGLLTWLITSALYLANIDIFGILQPLAYEYRESDSSSRISLLLINLEDGSIRNRGLFWEPAIFSQVNILGLFIYEIFKQRGEKISNKFFFVFTLAILSSFSTGGYLILFVYLTCFYFLKNNSSLLVYMGTLPIVLGLFFYADFLLPKILSQLGDAGNITSAGYYQGRLNIPFLFSVFLQSPIFGSGTYSVWESGTELNILFTTTWNGYLDFLISFGALVFIYFNYLIFSGAKNLLKQNFYVLSIIILLILTMWLNDIFSSPIFYLLPFWGMIQNKDFKELT